MKLPIKIKTEHFVLKPVSTDEINEFYKAFIESFDQLTQYYIPAWSRYKIPPAQDEMLQFLKQNQEEWITQKGFLLSVFDKKTNEFIGQGELHHFDNSVPKARLGYWIKNDKISKGYATEIAHALTIFGFDILNCNRLEIRNDVRNPASGKIAKKLGYKFLTIFEKNKIGKPNDFWNLEIYARTNKKNLPSNEIELIYGH